MNRIHINQRTHFLAHPSFACAIHEKSSLDITPLTSQDIQSFEDTGSSDQSRRIVTKINPRLRRSFQNLSKNGNPTPYETLSGIIAFQAAASGDLQLANKAVARHLSSLPLITTMIPSLSAYTSQPTTPINVESAIISASILLALDIPAALDMAQLAAAHCPTPLQIDRQPHIIILFPNELCAGNLYGDTLYSSAHTLFGAEKTKKISQALTAWADSVKIYYKVLHEIDSALRNGFTHLQDGLRRENTAVPDKEMLYSKLVAVKKVVTIHENALVSKIILVQQLYPRASIHPTESNDLAPLQTIPTYKP